MHALSPIVVAVIVIVLVAIIVAAAVTAIACYQGWMSSRNENDCDYGVHLPPVLLQQASNAIVAAQKDEVVVAPAPASRKIPGAAKAVVKARMSVVGPPTPPKLGRWH